MSASSPAPPAPGGSVRNMTSVFEDSAKKPRPALPKKPNHLRPVTSTGSAPDAAQPPAVAAAAPVPSPPAPAADVASPAAAAPAADPAPAAEPAPVPAAVPPAAAVGGGAPAAPPAVPKKPDAIRARKISSAVPPPGGVPASPPNGAGGSLRLTKPTSAPPPVPAKPAHRPPPPPAGAAPGGMGGMSGAHTMGPAGAPGTLVRSPPSQLGTMRSMPSFQEPARPSWEFFPETMIEVNDEEYTTPRDRTAKELFQTEQTYVKGLQFIVMEYIRPLRLLAEKDSAIIKTQEIQTIFYSIEDLLNLGRILLERLAVPIQSWGADSTLGDVFVQITPYLKVYTTYCAHFDEAAHLVADLESRNSNFARFLQTLKKHPAANGLDLRSLLITPVQRVPRYNLLLQDLLKRTDEGHPDCPLLEKALTSMREVATLINDGIREREYRNKIIDLQKNFVGDVQLVEPNRQLLRQGAMMKVCRKDHKKRFFFLFNDALIYAQPAAMDRYQLSQILPLASTTVTRREDDDVATNSLAVQSAKKSFVIYAESAEEADSWAADIGKAVDTCRQRLSSLRKGDSETQAAAPVWVHDKASKECQLCKSSFTTINRRHHCRACGALVCGSCSGHRAKVPNEDKPVRVCTNCFALISQQQNNAAAATEGEAPQ